MRRDEEEITARGLTRTFPFSFHMAVEMFDYLDDILQLQETSELHTTCAVNLPTETPTFTCSLQVLCDVPG